MSLPDIYVVRIFFVHRASKVYKLYAHSPLSAAKMTYDMHLADMDKKDPYPYGCKVKSKRFGVQWYRYKVCATVQTEEKDILC